MRKILRLFLPPSGSSRFRRIVSFGAVFGVPIFILLAIPPAWEYSNTAEFCGQTCHTMPPEYNTYLVSPHARVPCVDCHIGRDWIAKQAIRKSGHMRLVWATITSSYEYPIRISEMRPARETCERCHFPEKFSDDSLRAITRYADDEQNSPYVIYLLMHTGGGSQREGLGQGIHWHVENKIQYISLDKEEQEIPWVQVTYPDGTKTEYVSTVNPIAPDKLDDYTPRTMDCTSCHNRISHLIDAPDNLVDKAIKRGDLSQDIPYVRARAVEILSAEYETSEDAHAAIAGLEDYYRTTYPDFYASSGDKVTGAIALLQQLYSDNTYIEQELDWNTHPNNIGHRDSPGCFRCHDGQHVNAEQEVIRLECNLCHSVPQIVRPGVIEPMMPLTTGIEPTTHLDSTWISRHHIELNETCANCHSVDNAGGTTDTSFCSNSGCHGVDWRYAGFNAPLLAQELGVQPPDETAPVEVAPGESVTYQTLQPVFVEKCGQCHGASPIKGLKVIEYAGLMMGSENGPV
ncbi:MAG: NapC/NirT family cytochrome c, partial [Chloroflexi bacterium]|nr:NapC/NirT family cytochrome c [Chloroflexota bacterium]